MSREFPTSCFKMPEEKFYEIGRNKNNEEYIKCLACGISSYCYRDIENLYCSHCSKFHDIREYHTSPTLSWHEKRKLELREFYEKSRLYQNIFNNFLYEEMSSTEIESMKPIREEYTHLSENEMQTIYMGHLTLLFKSLKEVGVI